MQAYQYLNYLIYYIKITYKITYYFENYSLFLSRSFHYLFIYNILACNLSKLNLSGAFFLSDKKVKYFIFVV